jgi:hypothetical protein
VAICFRDSYFVKPPRRQAVPRGYMESSLRITKEPMGGNRGVVTGHKLFENAPKKCAGVCPKLDGKP